VILAGGGQDWAKYVRTQDRFWRGDHPKSRRKCSDGRRTSHALFSGVIVGVHDLCFSSNGSGASHQRTVPVSRLSVTGRGLGSGCLGVRVGVWFRRGGGGEECNPEDYDAWNANSDRTATRGSRMRQQKVLL